MQQSIQAIVQQLEQLIQKAHQSGSKYDFIDPAQELCQKFEALDDPAEAIEPLFMLIERSPDIDYGGPGPIGIFLESFEGGVYEEQLLQSLKRKPTLYTIHLLDVLLQDSNDPQQVRYFDTMRTIATDHTLPDALRQEALDNFQYATENLHPWDDALKERLAAAQTLLEEVSTQQAQRREALQQHEPLPPVETVNYNGISFKIITRNQAENYLPTITDLPGLDRLYDVWDEGCFPTWHENAYFLLAEESVTTEKLELDYTIPGVQSITVLGFIFLKDLHVHSHILAFDADNSPVLIVKGDVQCPAIHLFGNVHYIGGQVTTDLLWAKYNHGELYLDGIIHAKVILADDMRIFIRKPGAVAAIISIMGMNLYIKTGFEWLQEPSTHSVEEVFISEVCVVNEEGDVVLKDEGPVSAIDYIKQNKNILNCR